MEFLAYEIIPFALFQSLDEISDSSNGQLLKTGKLFIDFITRIARSLEGLIPQSFPMNALEVVSTIKKSLCFIKESYGTPDTQVRTIFYAIL